MRRKDKEVTDMSRIRDILDACAVCRLGIYDKTQDEVYIVPMNFAYSLEKGALTLYFHSALSGRKINLLRENPSVSFEMDCGHRLIPHTFPCEYSYGYSCIMGTGTVSFTDSPDQKAAVLSLLMEKQTGAACPVQKEQTASVAVFQVNVKQFSCKAQKSDTSQ